MKWEIKPPSASVARDEAVQFQFRENMMSSGFFFHGSWSVCLEAVLSWMQNGERWSVEREKVGFYYSGTPCFQTLAKLSIKTHRNPCISLIVCIMGWMFYSGINYFKCSCLKRVFESRLRFRTSSLSDVFCSCIGESPEEYHVKILFLIKIARSIATSTLK